MKWFDQPSWDFVLIRTRQFYSNRWLTTIIVEPLETINHIMNEGIRIALEKDNIESRPLWKPMQLQPVFKDAPFYGDYTSDDLFYKGLCLPSGSSMTDEEFDRVITIILSLFR